MSNIVNFGKLDDISLEDVFNLFLIFKSKDGVLTSFSISTVMESLARYKEMGRFSCIYAGITTEKNAEGKEIINIGKFLDQKKQEKLITNLSEIDADTIYILGTEETFEQLSHSYNKRILDRFNSLMFFINNDLEHGIENWELFDEVEVIKVPGYPIYCTGEFLDENKNDPGVKKAMKQKAIERARNNKYE